MVIPLCHHPLSAPAASPACKRFQTWRTVWDGNGSRLIGRDGANDDRPTLIVSRTDFRMPRLDTVEVWFMDNVLLLPSEY